MKKKNMRLIASCAIILGVVLAYFGIVGLYVVPGIHAFGANADLYALDKNATCEEIIHLVNGGEYELDEKAVSKLSQNGDVKALKEKLSGYLAEYESIQTQLEQEQATVLNEIQAKLDEISQPKKELMVAIRKAQKALPEGQTTSEEIDKLQKELDELNATYDQLVLEKQVATDQRNNAKGALTQLNQTVSEEIGFTKLAIKAQAKKATFSDKLDLFAHKGDIVLLVIGAIVLIAGIIGRIVFKEAHVSNLPDEFKEYKGEKVRYASSGRKFDFQKLLAPAALVILFAFFMLAGESFRTMTTMKAILENSYYIGLLAFGVTFVIMTGGIDLSLGTNMICSALIGCYAYSTWGLPLWLAVWLVPVIAMFFGFMNGVMIAKLKLPPFIATLGTQMITIGAGQIVTGVKTQYYPTIGSANTWFKTATFRVGSFPIGVMYLLLAFVIALILINKTKFGRYTLAIGSNEEAARLSGVNTDRWKIIVYTVCGLFVGFAGIMYASVNTVIIPGYGSGQELNGIAAVVIGGTSMAGGSGSIVGTLIGVFIMSVLKSGLTSVGLQSHWQTFFTGFVVIGAVLLDQLRTASAQKVKAPKANKANKASIK